MNQKLRFLYFIGIRNSFLSVWAKLGYSQIKIDHIADSLLKDAVFMVGVNLRLCLLSLCYYRLSKKAKVKLSIIKYHKWASTLRITLIWFGVWCFISCCKSFDRPWTWAFFGFEDPFDMIDVWCFFYLHILYTPLRN